MEITENIGEKEPQQARLADYDVSAPKKTATGFFRAVAARAKLHQLGDLMLASGLISKEQLERALFLQKCAGLPLGKILVQEGYVSASQLYRKLAEQWCLKTSMTGMAIMLTTSVPSIARAADPSGSGDQVRLASAFSPAAFKPAREDSSYPHIFGSTEVRSSDISAFTKWTDVIRRFEQQMKERGDSAMVSSWKAKLQNLKGRDVSDQVRLVNEYVNSVEYIEDSKNYGKTDQWATPMEFFAKGGDCEDFAIAKYASLRALGFSADQMRIAIVQDKIKNIPHAILIVYTEDKTYVLDNQDKRTREVADVVRYKPIFSINSSNWWLHKV